MPINPKKNFFKRGRLVDPNAEKTPPVELSQHLFAVSKFTPRPPLREKKAKTKLTTEEKADLRRKRKQEKLKFKREHKITRPVFLQVENDSEASKAKSASSTSVRSPPFNMKINNKKNAIEIRVCLHKVPPHLVTVDCTETTFHLDTLKWTSKYVLDSKYIYGIEVDPALSTAEFSHGSLLVTLPITKFSEEAKVAQRKLNTARREERQIRFVQGRNTELIGIRVRPQKSKKSAATQAIDNVVRNSNKKRKMFLDSKQKALELVEQAATEEEEKVASKQVQMGRISQYLQARAEISRERKSRASEESLQRATENKKQKLNEIWESVPVPMSSGQTADTSGAKKRRVSFAATPEVAVYQSNDDPKAPKKKQKEKITIQHE